MDVRQDRRSGDARIAVLEEQMRAARQDHAEMHEEIKALRGEISELRDEVRAMVVAAKASAALTARFARIGASVVAVLSAIGTAAWWAWQHVRLS